MARPTATALDWINFYATSLAGGWGGNTNAAILTAANNPTVANPATQATVPKPFTLTQVLGELSAASQGNLTSPIDRRPQAHAAYPPRGRPSRPDNRAGSRRTRQRLAGSAGRR